jgi:chemotaxis regulatin CheY-phosphate phosphatase CheZ
MKRLYGDSLRKDAGLTRVLKTVTRRHAQALDKHVPELAEVAQDLRKRLEGVYGETAVAFEDLLARCKSCFARSHFYIERGIDELLAKPKVRELVLDTTKAFKRRRYTLVYTCVTSTYLLEMV